MLHVIRKGETYQWESALSVLQDWGFALPPADFSSLIARGSSEVHVAALHYAAKLGGHAYTDVLTPLAASPNPWVAAEAKKTLKSLSDPVRF